MPPDETEVDPTEDYHRDHGEDCPGTCDHCGFWLCRLADDIALCDCEKGLNDV